ESARIHSVGRQPIVGSHPGSRTRGTGTVTVPHRAGSARTKLVTYLPARDRTAGSTRRACRSASRQLFLPRASAAGIHPLRLAEVLGSFPCPFFPAAAFS